MRLRIPAAVLAALALAVVTASPAAAASDSRTADTGYAYTGTWSTTNTTAKQSWTTGSTATASVNVSSGGGTVSVLGTKGPGMGRLSVSVDGGAATTVDSYQTAWADGTLHTTAALPAGCHSVKVTVLGTKASASTGTTVKLTGVSTTNGAVVPNGGTCTATPPPAPVQPALTVSISAASPTSAKVDWDYTAGDPAANPDTLWVGYTATAPDGTTSSGGVAQSPADGTTTFTGLTPGSTVQAYVTLYRAGAVVSESGYPTVTLPAAETPPPSTAPTLAVTTSEVTSSSARLTWDYTAGTDPSAVDGVRVGRDGNDANGSGPWSTVEPVGDGSRVFTNLLPNTIYTLYAEMVKGGVVVGQRQSVQVATSSGTTTPPPTGGTDWLSGGAGPGVDNSADFGNWRGAAVESVATWNDSWDACENSWSVSGIHANWNGPLINVMGAFDSRLTWAQAATGGADAHWRACLNSLKAAWGTRPAANLYVSFAHEANGNWYPWSVTSANLNNFKTALTRFNGLLDEIIPGARLVMAMNADQVQAGYDVADMLPAPGVVDVLGVDIYSMHAPAEFDRFPGIAASYGVPLVIQEWGIKRDEGGAAAWVQAIRDRIVANAGTGAGKLIMENYFNIGEYQIYPTTSSPQGAQRYRDLW